MKIGEYLTGLGAPFEVYCKQDSGNKCYSFSTPEGAKWVKVLNLEQTPLADVRFGVRNVRRWVARKPHRRQP